LGPATLKRIVREEEDQPLNKELTSVTRGAPEGGKPEISMNKRKKNREDARNGVHGCVGKKMK